MRQCILCGRKGSPRDFIEADGGEGWQCKFARACDYRRGLRSRHQNDARDEYGVIVTLVERASGDTWVEHRPGLAQDALTDVLKRFPAKQWRVRTISTPRTILADLNGRADVIFGRPHVNQWGFAAVAHSRPQVERNLLVRIPGGLEYLQ